MKKSYIAAALALTSCLVLGTAAASQSKTVTATFRPDMTLKVNGTTYTVRDTTGVRVSPLVYNGTTYLPLASLSQLLGAEVSWDQNTQTILIHDDDSASDYIGEAKAKEIALSHAGLSANKATFLELKLDREDGRVVYEVEFYSGNKEYDYEILAADGTILSYDADIEGYYLPSSSKGATSTSSNRNASSSGLITRDRAKQIALEHAGLSSSDVNFVKAELDEDDGRFEYEIEFHHNFREYEYTIDAASGTILEAERD